jgi:hypothetical protein
MGRRFGTSLAVIVAAVGLLAPATADAGAGVSVITYSVQGKGNVSSLDTFAAVAAATYADPRGWNLGGSIRFDRVASGGDFTLWLAADALMSTFGGACDVIWSCRNGRNVVINEDRWLGASDAWNAGVGTLAGYRQMVVNHETGHWLGFDHGHCSGPGAAAPVMQQQSMSLGLCDFNSWPVPAERAELAGRRGVPIIQTGSTPSTTSTTAKPPASTTTTIGGAPATTTTTTPRPAATTTTTRRPGTVVSSSVPLENRCLVRMAESVLRPWRRCF